MRVCPRCKNNKEDSSFCKNKARRNGLDVYCKICKMAVRRESKNKQKPRSAVASTLHKTIVLPDMHVPYHDEYCVEAVLEFIKYFKPDRIVQLGDFCDFASLSRHDYKAPEDIVHLEYELGECHKMLDRIEAVLPKDCEKYMVGGNHEDRWHAARVRHRELPPKISSTIKKLAPSWGTELRLTQRGWNWCEYNGRQFDSTSHPEDHFTLGKVVYTHGKFTGESCAKQMAEQFRGQNVIFGHTHGHYVFGCHDENRQPIESESIGTLMKPSWAFYLQGKKPSRWCHGFSIIYTRKSGLFQKVFTHILNGKFIVNGRQYGNSGLISTTCERKND